LPNLLVQVLSICRQHLGDDAVDPTPWLSLAEQAGRTAANLVAENGESSGRTELRNRSQQGSPRPSWICRGGQLDVVQYTGPLYASWDEQGARR
jgi:hypothetical protein